jgi:predicted DNA-binding antitoxin AbrB/MazE fold protein
MTRVTDAVYLNGVLKPLSELTLREAQRVRLTVESIEDQDCHDRTAALERLLAGIQEMEFRLTGRFPTRDELHDRF